MIHGAGDIHKTEHHRLTGGHFPLGKVVVAQIESVDKGHLGDALFKLFNLLFELQYPLGTGTRGVLQLCQFVFQLQQSPLLVRGHSGAPRQRGSQRADDIDRGGHSIIGITGSVSLVFHQFVQAVFLQVGQLKIFKQELEVLIFGDLKYKVILTLA